MKNTSGKRFGVSVDTSFGVDTDEGLRRNVYTKLHSLSLFIYIDIYRAKHEVIQVP